jgi:hypothetical protein
MKQYYFALFWNLVITWMLNGVHGAKKKGFDFKFLKKFNKKLRP